MGRWHNILCAAVVSVRRGLDPEQVALSDYLLRAFKRRGQHHAVVSCKRPMIDRRMRAGPNRASTRDTNRNSDGSAYPGFGEYSRAARRFTDH